MTAEKPVKEVKDLCIFFRKDSIVVSYIDSNGVLNFEEFNTLEELKDFENRCLKTS